MTENEIGRVNVNAVIAVHRQLGPGLLNRFTKLSWLMSCKNAVFA